MKTISLLPKHEELEELQDELVTQLLDYQQCKRMAQMVKDRLALGTFVREQMKLKKDLTYRGHHDTGALLKPYQTAVGKGKRFLPPPMESFSAIVATPTVSVASRMIHVLRCVWKEHEVPYTKVFEQAESKSQMVATVLAVLELSLIHIYPLRPYTKEEAGQTIDIIDRFGNQFEQEDVYKRQCVGRTCIRNRR